MNDRPKLRSRITTNGIDRVPHRVFMRGMGLDDAAIARPFIGVVTTHGETTPCTGNSLTKRRTRTKACLRPVAPRARSRRSRFPTASA
jgi:dihydroxyacid dehydratase/phosphogluconate dehydratase